jgi:hypothetical protein
MTGQRLNLTPRAEWAPTPRERGEGMPCKKSCCWSPFGHSTVRDNIPAWHKDACHCHNPKEQS